MHFHDDEIITMNKSTYNSEEIFLEILFISHSLSFHSRYFISKGLQIYWKYQRNLVTYRANDQHC